MKKPLCFISGCIFGALCLMPVSISSLDLAHEKARVQFLKVQQKCIEEALWFEARGESKLGIAAVLSVIQNRVQHRNYPSTYCEVIQQHKQFSYRNGYSKGVFIPYNPRFGDVKMDIIKRLSQEAIDGTFNNLLDKNVLFYSTIHVKPVWAKDMKKVLQIDQHQFYAEKE
jgi:spore germination cell wall hydrolase CwlJ-like protein